MVNSEQRGHEVILPKFEDLETSTINKYIVILVNYVAGNRGAEVLIRISVPRNLSEPSCEQVRWDFVHNELPFAELLEMSPDLMYPSGNLITKDVIYKVIGGGLMRFDTDKHTITIKGVSKTFGSADKNQVKSLIQKDYPEWNVVIED